MEQPVYHDRDEHVIDIANTGIASGSVSHGNDHNDSDQQLNGDLAASTTTQVTVMQSSASSATTTSRNSLGALHDPGFWNLASLALKVIQITAAVVVIPVSISRHEHPPTALFTWITVYTATLFATILCELWDYV